MPSFARRATSPPSSTSARSPTSPTEPTMPLPALAAVLLSVALPPQESVVPPPPRVTLPRPVANAAIARVNDNRRPAGVLSKGTLTVSLDVVEAAYQPEGELDPVELA